ncbi:hypothetical protein Daura_28195 [Dactylosporangium aurantiacum]|uniref:Uncharacterized protein n=1 Tax=Dactylosporangium aurantiacum TaxID=35754 RepID=A0A9Q9IDR7_9ACTN|nr:hypothetical protein [Dactylosporangium aurantiacum]MDG6106940.1 hypothetical protein [Dactylosporangium aurantiacum]UWZ50700.1 hypothetical protein Daura_28195 [Dactylosporangium aurantiacum]
MRRWDFGALRTVAVGGVAAVAGMFSTVEQSTVCTLHEADTGRLLGGWPMPYDWSFSHPDAHLSTVVAHGEAYSIVRGRGSDYTVHRLTLDGPVLTGRFEPDGDGVHTVAPGVVSGRPAVLSSDWRRVHYHHLRTGARLRPPWTAPDGWQVEELVAVGGRTYAWLEPRDDTPRTDWRCWLWDAVTGRPVAPPVFVRGYRWGPWPLGRRPALLVKADWQDYRVLDLALGRPVGPALPRPAADLTAPAAGVLHGRAVLAAAAGTALTVWDLLSGAARHVVTLPEPPLAVAVAADRLYVADPAGGIGAHPVPLRSVHPLAGRAPQHG